MGITRGQTPGLKWTQIRAHSGAPPLALELDRSPLSLLAPASLFFGGQWVSASVSESSSAKIPIRALSLCIVQYAGLWWSPLVHLSIFTLLTKSIIHHHLLSSSTRPSLAAAAARALQD